MNRSSLYYYLFTLKHLLREKTLKAEKRLTSTGLNKAQLDSSKLTALFSPFDKTNFFVLPSPAELKQNQSFLIILTVNYTTLMNVS